MKLLELAKKFNDIFPFQNSFMISALKNHGLEKLQERLTELANTQEWFFAEDQVTTAPLRFFVQEIIREKILELYHQEIPYSTEVVINAFKETETNSGEPLVRIDAEIYVMRDTQKSILIGKGGSAIKKMGTEARKAIETLLESKVFLEMHVRVRDNWRDDEAALRNFGYDA
jgi:GTP-binding protein Era